MSDRKRILLYFGSFNPIHKAHIAIAEYALDRDLADEVVLVVSPHSPFKDPGELASEFHRFEMVEIAAAASRYPDRILPSLVETTLPKPSYTINTLRFLAEKFPDVRFSILMGADNVEGLGGWKGAGEIIGGYDIYVYPRPGEAVRTTGERMHVLENAPLSPVSSTEIRRLHRRGENIEPLVPAGVADYIENRRLWQ